MIRSVADSHYVHKKHSISQSIIRPIYEFRNGLKVSAWFPVPFTYTDTVKAWHGCQLSIHTAHIIHITLSLLVPHVFQRSTWIYKTHSILTWYQCVSNYYINSERLIGSVWLPVPFTYTKTGLMQICRPTWLPVVYSHRPCSQNTLHITCYQYIAKYDISLKRLI